MNTIKTLLIGLLLGFLFSGVILVVTSRPVGSSIKLEEPPTQSPDMVYITGAVVKPGLYSIAKNSRIIDAVNAAGGMLQNADQNNVNLAGKLKDGEKIFIPFINLDTPEPVKTIIPGDKHTPIPTPSISNQVNINSADEAQLDMLPGIGEQKAKQIVLYREKNGLFADINELLKVNGISQNLFNQIKELITTH